ncbi:MAG: 4-(cytidine 5'-diphospho)-2-C-methyl-D-erythritol kinase, partial [Dehalococcoidia bacterium]
MLTVSAYAKINLTLEVLGIYSDGYHEVATVLQEIDLKETLFFEEYQDIRLKSPENLVLKAARLLQDAGKCNKGALISIKKGIPIAAGLGGSSSDAAATLRGLNELWGLDFSLSELTGVASRVSADTAFFLYGGTALGEGRGERITPLPPFVPLWVVLFRPPVSVPPNKTESLYASLNPSHFTDGQFSKKIVGLLRQGGDVCNTSLFNVFEKVAFTTFPG